MRFLAPKTPASQSFSTSPKAATRMILFWVDSPKHQNILNAIFQRQIYETLDVFEFEALCKYSISADNALRVRRETIRHPVGLFSH